MPADSRIVIAAFQGGRVGRWRISPAEGQEIGENSRNHSLKLNSESAALIMSYAICALSSRIREKVSTEM